MSSPKVVPSTTTTMRRTPRCKCGAHDWHPIHKKNDPRNSWLYHEYEPWPEEIEEFVRQLERMGDEVTKPKRSFVGDEPKRAAQRRARGVALMTRRRFEPAEVAANAVSVLLGLAGAAWFCSYFLKGGM